VIEVDGRTIGDGKPGPVVARLQQLYAELVREDIRRGREAVMREVEGSKKVVFP